MSSSSSSGSGFIPSLPFPVTNCGCPPDPPCPNPGITQGSGGVRGFDGKIVLSSAASIATTGYNCPFGTSLQYDNLAGGVSVGFGKNWQPTSGLGGLTFNSGIVTYEEGANSKKVFAPLGGGFYQAGYFVLDRLFFDSGTNEYRLTSPDGSSKTFNSTGQLISFKNAGGFGGTVNYTSGQLDYIVVSDGAEFWEFDYTWSGSLVQNIVFKLNGNNVRKADYAYDGSGNLLTIKTYAYLSGSWGSQTVEAVRYSYDANNLVRPTR
jgi:hypothetical protein